MEDITLDKPQKTLENGQILFEVEKDIWLDYETYKPKPPEENVTTNEV